MNKKILGIVLGGIAVLVGALFIIVGINQMRSAGNMQQPLLSEEEIKKAVDASQGETATYENVATGIRLDYPKSWTKEEGKNGAVVFKTFDGAVNVRFISDDLTAKKEPVSLKEYTDELMQQSVSQAEEQNVAIKAISDGDTTLAGLPAHQWLYTVTLDSIKAQGMQVWTVKNNHSYVLTFTAPQSLFEQFLPAFKKMLEAVVVTK